MWMRFISSMSFILFFNIVTGQHLKTKEDWADLKKYKVANMQLDTINKHRRVVFMGDSNTEFWKPESFFQENGYINRGISGQTTSQMLLRFRQDVIMIKPAIVVILAGINDIAENNGPIALEDVSGNIISMIQLALTHKIIPVVCSVLPANRFSWRPDIYPSDSVIKLNTMLKNYCKINQVHYVDYYTSMVDQQNGLNKQYSDDGVHPTLAGYKVMEAIIHKELKVILSKN